MSINETKLNFITVENASNEAAAKQPIQKSMSGKKPHFKAPDGTTEYLVQENDTIEHIALKWNTIPSEIQHLNRLINPRMIFPGQVLYVPDPNYVKPKPELSKSNENLASPIKPNTITVEEAKSRSVSFSTKNKQPLLSPQKNANDTNNNTKKSYFSWGRSSPKPGHVEPMARRNTIAAQTPTETPKDSQFLKHTLSEDEAKKLDEECMQRFLKLNSKLVTPRGVVDGILLITPSAIMFDPLTPNESIKEESGASSASSLSSSPGSDSPRRRLSSSAYENDSVIVPIEVISNVILYEDLLLKDVHEYVDKRHEELKQKKKEDREKKSGEQIELQSRQVGDMGAEQKNEPEAKDEVFEKSDEAPESEQQQQEQQQLIIEQIVEQASNKNVTQEAVQRLETKRKEIALKRHSLNNILNSFDEDLRCYLCIKINYHKEFIACPIDRKMKNRLQPEFWFQVPDNSYKITDKICAFFLSWKFEQASYGMSTETQKGSFQLVRDYNKKLVELTSTLKEDLTLINNNRLQNQVEVISNRVSHTELFVKDWEVVNLSELESKMKVEREESQIPLPTLIGQTKILKEEHLRMLNNNLIARAVSYNWFLSFSTELHGFSLNTLYRQMSEVESPSLIVVRDTNDHIFGAMTSCRLYQDEHFYGTGESFLYTFYPNFKIFKWTGDNLFFIKGSSESLGIGCGDGIFGLWFDSDLYHGSTHKCKTYDNELLTESEDFTIAELEVWTFVD